MNVGLFFKCMEKNIRLVTIGTESSYIFVFIIFLHQQVLSEIKAECQLIQYSADHKTMNHEILAVFFYCELLH